MRGMVCKHIALQLYPQKYKEESNEYENNAPIMRPVQEKLCTSLVTIMPIFTVTHLDAEKLNVYKYAEL